MKARNLSVDFCGLRFANPFVLAASPSTDDRDMIARGLDAGWAGAVFKTTSVPTEEVSIAYPIMSSLEPGNGMVGLHNIDLISERHIDRVAEDVRWLKERFPESRLALSIMASQRAEWERLVRQGEEAGADLIEISISCPQGSMLEGEHNTQGWMISQDAQLTEKVTRWVKQAARIPVYAKLSPAVTDIAAIGRAAERAGADALCAIDSVEAIVGVDLETLAPMPSVSGASSYGGYSGRAIKPIALRCVANLGRAVSIPISGVGGVYDWRDAVQFILLGATTVQVCTAVMHRGFGIVDSLGEGMSRWMNRHGYTSVHEFVGLSLSRIKDHQDLVHGLNVLSHVNLARCIGCGHCYVACRDGGHVAIDWSSDRQPTVDAGRCVGCGLCAQVCPVPDCIRIESVLPQTA